MTAKIFHGARRDVVNECGGDGLGVGLGDLKDLFQP